jgi:hypothetical protein
MYIDERTENSIKLRRLTLQMCRKKGSWKHLKLIQKY